MVLGVKSLRTTEIGYVNIVVQGKINVHIFISRVYSNPINFLQKINK